MSLTTALLLAPLSPHQPWRKAKGNTMLGSEDSAVSVQELQVNEEKEDKEQEEDPQFGFGHSWRWRC
nr:hypothetical protein Iba_chr03aCG2670 [Ipomoea batatas]GMC69014.1 hypothetical protein Iba_chr03aCG2680 [Ipomoea batatas]